MTLEITVQGQRPITVTAMSLVAYRTLVNGAKVWAIRAETSASNAAASEVQALTSAAEALQSEQNAANSESAAKVSEDAAKVSEDASKVSEDASKVSEDASKISEDAAKVSETAAKLSEDNAKLSETASKISEDASKISEDASKVSETAAKISEDASKVSETAAKISEDAAKISEDASKVSEDNAKLSETASKTSEDAAKISETAAKASEDAAKISEDNAKLSEGITQLDAWEAEAEAMTADSFAQQAEDVEVVKYTSNGDGTFTATPLPNTYSSLHWSLKAASSASGLNYQATWDASTGVYPTVRPDSTPLQPNDFWIVDVAGTIDGTDWLAQDWMVRNSTNDGWDRLPNIIEWNAILNVPANVSNAITDAELQAGLAPKADTTYVNSQLALKENTTDVNSKLALKADITYVDSENAAQDTIIASKETPAGSQAKVDTHAALRASVTVFGHARMSESGGTLTITTV